MLQPLQKALDHMVGPGTLIVRDGSGSAYHFGDGGDGWPQVTVALADRATEWRILMDPKLGAAEAFIDGRLTIEQGDVMALAQLVRGGNPHEKKKPVNLASPVVRVKRGLRQSLRRANHRRAARANVAHHYDLDDRLYDLFLDPWRQYSCAYWRDGAGDDSTPDLAAAQRSKIAHIAAKLDLKAGQKVLDIGCGWGGMAIALHKLTGARVKGITLSREQHSYACRWAAREGVADAVRFELVDYRDVDGQFDRIVSVGMFEHVGVPDYPAFFRRCRDLLSDDGVMLLHTIGRIVGPGATDAFTRKYIFPGGYIPALSEIMPSSEAARLMLTDAEVLRLHYAHTLRAWYDACVAQESRIVAVFDERFFRLWTFYLAGATAAFESGGMVNFQLQYARNRRSLPMTRDYMAEREAEYRAMLDRVAQAADSDHAIPRTANG